MGKPVPIDNYSAWEDQVEDLFENPFKAQLQSSEDQTLHDTHQGPTRGRRCNSASLPYQRQSSQDQLIPEQEPPQSDKSSESCSSSGPDTGSAHVERSFQHAQCKDLGGDQRQARNRVRIRQSIMNHKTLRLTQALRVTLQVLALESFSKRKGIFRVKARARIRKMTKTRRTTRHPLKDNKAPFRTSKVALPLHLSFHTSLSKTNQIDMLHVRSAR